MGTFMGHALPGSFFIIFASWWIINIWIRYFRSKQRGTEFRSSATFKCSCLCGKLGTWQVEGALKMLFCSIGLTGEMITGFDDKGNFVNFGNAQHITMFAAFGLSGLIDILMHHDFPIPKGMDYVGMLVAVMVEGVLFLFHLHGRKPMDIQVHILLVYVLGASIVSLLVEMYIQNSVLAALARSYCVLIQGTWFWQVGAILYPHHVNPNASRWDEEDHEQMMITVLIFAWHMIIDFIVIIIMGAAVNCYIKRTGNCYDAIQMQNLIHKDSTGQTVINLGDSDNDSDLEFEKPSRATVSTK
ncbi:unnamed protein product [Owenia fusiformis]|uniref:Uncharacterized protein n=1 Tax=Owenia fusiformis TaxID=6347 RepID=A0A8J1TAZ4_OWEFU|nr:unnamed protein product [Owenia fusiformis]